MTCAVGLLQIPDGFDPAGRIDAWSVFPSVTAIWRRGVSFLPSFFPSFLPSSFFFFNPRFGWFCLFQLYGRGLTLSIPGSATTDQRSNSSSNDNSNSSSGSGSSSSASSHSSGMLNKCGACAGLRQISDAVSAGLKILGDWLRNQSPKIRVVIIKPLIAIIVRLMAALNGWGDNESVIRDIGLNKWRGALEVPAVAAAAAAAVGAVRRNWATAT